MVGVVVVVVVVVVVGNLDGNGNGNMVDNDTDAETPQRIATPASCKPIVLDPKRRRPTTEVNDAEQVAVAVHVNVHDHDQVNERGEATD